MRRWPLVLLAVTLAGCGGGGGERDAGFDPFDEVRDRTTQTPERSSPRWEAVATLSGSGPAREAVTIAPGAIQWRARYRCESGRLAVAAGGRTVADASCRGAGTMAGVRTGELTLGIEAADGWRVAIDQQVDTPLRESPSKAMQAPGARVVARGEFYAIERRGRGTAELHRLASGRLALRFEGFSTSPNSDLFVWLSTASRPRTTVQAARAEHIVLRELKSTLGEQNYLIPARVDAADIRSIVIWCVPVRIAYAAASLRGT